VVRGIERDHAMSSPRPTLYDVCSSPLPGQAMVRRKALSSRASTSCSNLWSRASRRPVGRSNVRPCARTWMWPATVSGKRVRTTSRIPQRHRSGRSRDRPFVTVWIWIPRRRIALRKRLFGGFVQRCLSTLAFSRTAARIGAWRIIHNGLDTSAMTVCHRAAPGGDASAVRAGYVTCVPSTRAQGVSV